MWLLLVTLSILAISIFAVLYFIGPVMAHMRRCCAGKDCGMNWWLFFTHLNVLVIGLQLSNLARMMYKGEY